MTGFLKRAGMPLKFNDVMIGQPFFAHGVFWTRISPNGASEIRGSDWVGAKVCDFMCDAPDERGEDVEYVSFEKST